MILNIFEESAYFDLMACLGQLKQGFSVIRHNWDLEMTWRVSVEGLWQSKRVSIFSFKYQFVLIKIWQLNMNWGYCFQKPNSFLIFLSLLCFLYSPCEYKFVLGLSCEDELKIWDYCFQKPKFVCSFLILDKCLGMPWFSKLKCFMILYIRTQKLLSEFLVYSLSC